MAAAYDGIECDYAWCSYYLFHKHIQQQDQGYSSVHPQTLEIVSRHSMIPPLSFVLNYSGRVQLISEFEHTMVYFDSERN
jgi:hypothetical protein